MNAAKFLDPETTATLLDQLEEGVYATDNERRSVYWSAGAERITGYSAEKTVGTLCYDNLLRHVDEDGRPLCVDGCPLAHTLADGQSREANVLLHHRDSHRLPVRVRVFPRRDPTGAVIGAIEVFADRSGHEAGREQMEFLQRMSLVDTLTGVLNRRGIEAMLESRFHDHQRYAWSFGVLFIDVDGLKRVNDQHGHVMGDRVLRAIGETLASNLRASDSVGRWGGDEFVVVAAGLDEGALHRKATQLAAVIRTLTIVGAGGTISASASVGAAVVVPDDTPETLIARADQRMYARKHELRGAAPGFTAPGRPAAPRPRDRPL